jgi:phosphoglycolate phosphatase
LINNYKHIIWDWNGTLMDDVEYCKNIINKILIKNNLPELSIERYREIFTFPVQNYYEAAGLDFNKTSFEVLGKEFMIDYELNKLNCKLYDNAKDVLSEIHGRGLKQSVLSAYKHNTLVEVLKSYNLFNYFDNVIGSDNIYAGSKLHLGLKLIEMLDVGKNEILFVGDTIHDYDVANAMGVNSVLIANGHQAKHKLRSNGAFVLDTMKDLSKYLFN